MAVEAQTVEQAVPESLVAELRQLRTNAENQFTRFEVQLQSVAKDLHDLKKLMAQLVSRDQQAAVPSASQASRPRPEPAALLMDRDTARTGPAATSWSENQSPLDNAVKRGAKSFAYKEASTSSRLPDDVAQACANIQKIATRHKKEDIRQVASGFRKKKTDGDKDDNEAIPSNSESQQDGRDPRSSALQASPQASPASSFGARSFNELEAQRVRQLPSVRFPRGPGFGKALSAGPHAHFKDERRSHETPSGLQSTGDDDEAMLLGVADLPSMTNHSNWDVDMNYPGSVPSESSMSSKNTATPSLHHEDQQKAAALSVEREPSITDARDALVCINERNDSTSSKSPAVLEEKDDVEAVPRTAKPPEDEPATPSTRPTYHLIQLFRWTISAAVQLPARTFKFLRVLVWDILMPESSFRTAWDLLTLLMLVFVCVVVPYLVCFDIDTSDISQGIGLWNFILNCLFMADIYFNFRTGYQGEDGKYETRHVAIANNYLRGWFFVDSISSIPWDLLASNSAVAVFKILKTLRVARLSRIVKVFSAAKLLRLLKVAGLVRKLGKILGSTFVRLLTVILGALMLIHWNACAFYLASSFTGHSENQSWIGKAGLSEEPLKRRYIFSLYWAVTTMTTVGYGDITAISVFEKLFSMFTMLLGASIFAYFMGSMSTILATHNAVAARMARKKQAVEDFLTHRKLPTQLADRVHTFYDYVVEREVHGDEAEIISGLSNALRTDVILHMYKEALEKVPFFRGKHPQFITSLVTHLKLEFYAPGDIVVQQGDVGTEMYFIGEGTLEVRLYKDARSITSFTNDAAVAREGLDRRRTKLEQLKRWVMSWFAHDDVEEAVVMPHPEYRIVGHMGKGQYFGEVACLTGSTRLATVVALDFCELYSLTRVDLESVIERWPALAMEFELLVKEYKNEEPQQQHRHSADDGDDGGSAYSGGDVNDDDGFLDPYWKFKEVAEKSTKRRSADDVPGSPTSSINPSSTALEIIRASSPSPRSQSARTSQTGVPAIGSAPAIGSSSDAVRHGSSTQIGTAPTVGSTSVRRSSSTKTSTAPPVGSTSARHGSTSFNLSTT